MRLFTAIDLPVEMVEKLSAFLARLRSLAKLRWAEVEDLHITTKFLHAQQHPLDKCPHKLHQTTHLQITQLLPAKTQCSTGYCTLQAPPAHSTDEKTKANHLHS